VSNFILFEQRRLEAAPTTEAFVPVGIEAEAWDWEPEIGSVPMMGFADVILQAASVPEIPTDDGVVIIDFKTGNGIKAEKYKDEPGSVLDELEYYAMLFEGEYEIGALAGYFPRDDLVISSVPEEDRRARLEATVEEMAQNGTDASDYAVKPGPLCKWGPTSEQQSAYYGICPCKWGTPDGPGPTYVNNEKQPLN
jgi:hypothetical protein